MRPTRKYQKHLCDVIMGDDVSTFYEPNQHFLDKTSQNSVYYTVIRYWDVGYHDLYSRDKWYPTRRSRVRISSWRDCINLISDNTIAYNCVILYQLSYTFTFMGAVPVMKPLLPLILDVELNYETFLTLFVVVLNTIKLPQNWNLK